MSSQVIVTISSQPGCGGNEIGQRLSGRLSLNYVDKRAVSQAARGIDAIFENDKSAVMKKSFWEILRQTPILTNIEHYIPPMKSIVSDAPVHEKEEEILLKLVGKEGALVVGRGGFHRFRDYPNLIKIFISADWVYRLENYMFNYGLSEEDAEELLSTTDQATERYIRKVTGKDMFDVRNYDLALNISRLDFNIVTDTIENFIRLGHMF